MLVVDCKYCRFVKVLEELCENFFEENLPWADCILDELLVLAFPVAVVDVFDIPEDCPWDSHSRAYSLGRELALFFERHVVVVLADWLYVFDCA